MTRYNVVKIYPDKSKQLVLSFQHENDAKILKRLLERKTERKYNVEIVVLSSHPALRPCPTVNEISPQSSAGDMAQTAEQTTPDGQDDNAEERENPIQC